MDQALFLRCSGSQILSQPSFITRSKIISPRKLTNSRDLIFFSSKNTTTTTTPLISSLSKCFSTTLTVGHPQRINARRLISTTTLVRAENTSPAQSPSSDDNGETEPLISPLELLKGFLHGILYLTSSTDEPKSEFLRMGYKEDFKKNLFDNIKSGKISVEKALEESPSGSLEKYENGLVSVEILIYKGRYSEALNRLDVLEKLGPKRDSRPRLFKAIIHTVMKDKNGTAKDSLDELIKKGFEHNFPSLG